MHSGKVVPVDGMSDEFDSIAVVEENRLMRKKVEHYLLTSITGFILDVGDVVLSLVACTLYIIESYYPEDRIVDDKIRHRIYILNAVSLALALFFLINFFIAFYIAGSRRYYLFTFSAIVDMASIIPILMIWVPRIYGAEVHATVVRLEFLRFVRVMKILRILRLQKLLGLSESEVQRQIFTVLFTVLSIIFCYAGLFQVIENACSTAQELADAWDGPDHVWFHDAVYFTVVTVATVGYGDFYPVSVPGKFLVMIMIASTIIVVSRQTNKLITLMGLKSKYARSYFQATASTSHVVVCGHINFATATNFFREFFHEDHGARDTSVVLLSPSLPSSGLEWLLRLPEYSYRSCYLEGSAMNPKDLARAAVDKANAVFVLGDKTSSDAQGMDAASILRAMAVKKFVSQVSGGGNILIILQLLRPENKHHFSLSGFSQRRRPMLMLESKRGGILGGIAARSPSFALKSSPSAPGLRSRIAAVGSSDNHNSNNSNAPSSPIVNRLRPLLTSNGEDDNNNEHNESSNTTINLNNNYNNSNNNNLNNSGMSSSPSGLLDRNRSTSSITGILKSVASSISIFGGSDSGTTNAGDSGDSKLSEKARIRRRYGRMKDQVLCTDEIKLSLIAKSCLCPGFCTLVSNLITSSSIDSDDERFDPCMREYVSGTGHEIYRAGLSPYFGGKTFGEVALEVFDALASLVFAVEIADIRGELRVVLSPFEYKIPIGSGTVYVFLLCEDKESADKLLTYTPARSRRNSTQQHLGENSSQHPTPRSFSFEAKSVVSISSSGQNINNNNDRSSSENNNDDKAHEEDVQVAEAEKQKRMAAAAAAARVTKNDDEVREAPSLVHPGASSPSPSIGASPPPAASSNDEQDNIVMKTGLSSHSGNSLRGGAAAGAGVGASATNSLRGTTNSGRVGRGLAPLPPVIRQSVSATNSASDAAKGGSAQQAKKGPVTPPSFSPNSSPKSASARKNLVLDTLGNAAANNNALPPLQLSGVTALSSAGGGSTSSGGAQSSSSSTTTPQPQHQQDNNNNNALSVNEVFQRMSSSTSPPVASSLPPITGASKPPSNSSMVPPRPASRLPTIASVGDMTGGDKAHAAAASTGASPSGPIQRKDSFYKRLARQPIKGSTQEAGRVPSAHELDPRDRLAYLKRMFHVVDVPLTLAACTRHKAAPAEITGHILVCGSTTGLYYFVAPLRCSYLPSIVPIVILHPDPPSKEWDTISMFEGVYYVQGSVLEPSDLIRAGALTASRVVVLSNMDATGDEEGKAHMVDADSIFAFQSLLQANRQIRRKPMPHVVCELVNPHNVTFLMSTDESHGGSANVNEAIKGGDAILAPPFAAGAVYIPSVLDMLACQAYYNQHLLTIIQELVLVGSTSVSEFQAPNVHPAHLFQVPVPISCVGSTYGVMFREMVEQGLLPLALYRSRDSIGMLSSGSGPTSVAGVASDESVSASRVGDSTFRSTGSQTNRSSGGISASSLPYVVTNPPFDTVVGASDLVFVLSSYTPIASTPRGGGGGGISVMSTSTDPDADLRVPAIPHLGSMKPPLGLATSSSSGNTPVPVKVAAAVAAAVAANNSSNNNSNSNPSGRYFNEGGDKDAAGADGDGVVGAVDAFANVYGVDSVKSIDSAGLPITTKIVPTVAPAVAAAPAPAGAPAPAPAPAPATAAPSTDEYADPAAQQVSALVSSLLREIQDLRKDMYYRQSQTENDLSTFMNAYNSGGVMPGGIGGLHQLIPLPGDAGVGMGMGMGMGSMGSNSNANNTNTNSNTNNNNNNNNAYRHRMSISLVPSDTTITHGD